jgi:hypothetical protein
MAANGLDAYAITVREERQKPTKLLGAFDGRRSLFDVIYAKNSVFRSGQRKS